MLVYNAKLLKPLVAIKNELIRILTLRTIEHGRFQLQEFDQHLMIITIHNKTQQTMKEKSLSTFPPTLGIVIAIGGLAGT